MSVKTKKIDLTVYLSKDGFDTAEQVLKPDVSYSKVVINTGGNELGTLFLMDSKSKLPLWASLFSGIVSPEKIGRNQAIGALFGKGGRA